VDFTNKASPRLLSRTTYDTEGYTHQGWLTEDHNTFLFGDETDERAFNISTRTLVLDVRNLENPWLVGSYYGNSKAVDHNQYVLGRRVYQANYRAGVRILQIGNAILDRPDLDEVAYFDAYPEDDDTNLLGGTWSVYPYLPSKRILASSMDRGLFVLQEEEASVEAATPELEPSA